MVIGKEDAYLDQRICFFLLLFVRDKEHMFWRPVKEDILCLADDALLVKEDIVTTKILAMKTREWYVMWQDEIQHFDKQK